MVVFNDESLQHGKDFIRFENKEPRISNNEELDMDFTGLQT